MSSSDLCVPKLIIPDFTLELRLVGETHFSWLPLPWPIDNWYWLIIISTTTAFRLHFFALVCVTVHDAIAHTARTHWSEVHIVETRIQHSYSELLWYKRHYASRARWVMCKEYARKSCHVFILITMIFISWITKNLLTQISSP